MISLVTCFFVESRFAAQRPGPKTRKSSFQLALRGQGVDRHCRGDGWSKADFPVRGFRQKIREQQGGRSLRGTANIAAVRGSGRNAKALESGDKALALYPNDLDIVVSQINIAQATKNYGRWSTMPCKAATSSIPSQSSQSRRMFLMPTGKRASANEQEDARSSYEYVETAAYNAIASEQDASKRMSYIEKVHPGIPELEV